ncbi:MAG: hypothetical protein WD598_11470 [Acidimicrobiia bacterium]
MGELVADLTGRGVRAAAFVGDPAKDREVILELLAELFPQRSVPETTPPE